MKRRSFFGRLAAVCGLSALVKVDEPSLTLESARCDISEAQLAEVLSVLERMKRDLEITLLCERDEPVGRSAEEEFLHRHETAYVKGWISPEPAEAGTTNKES